MNDERLKQAYDKMNPDTQSEKRMLAEIIRKGESHMDRKFTVEPVKPSRWAAIPAVMAILAMIVLSVFVAVRFDLKDSTANDPTQEHDTVSNVITEPDTYLESEVPPDHEDSPEPMTIPSYGEVPPDAVVPLPQTLDTNNLNDCSVYVSVLSVTDSIHGGEIEVEVYVYDTYDGEDISNLQVGDILMIRNLPVEVVEKNRIGGEYLIINGNSPREGYFFLSIYGDSYDLVRFNDRDYSYSIGIVSLPVSTEFTLVDYSDPENPGSVYTFEDLVYVESLGEAGFTHENATIVIEDGVVTEMYRY